MVTTKDISRATQILGEPTQWGYEWSELLGKTLVCKLVLIGSDWVYCLVDEQTKKAYAVDVKRDALS